MPNTEHSSVIRRLAAIVVADVVGYTRLMERDEAGTHARLKEIRAQVVDPRIAAHGGRIIRTSGDGMLVEFGSATAALRCAIEIQREMGTRNLYVAPEERIEFRIGINLGDIIIDGDDIAGEGVNVASRLETLAEAGGICIAATVLEHAHEDLGVSFVDIGEQQVKNIVRPIRVYRITLGKTDKAASAAARQSQQQRSTRRRWLLTAIATVCMIGVGIWLVTLLWKPAAVPAPPELSLAILPFTAPSGSPGDEQFAAALTLDVNTALAQKGNVKVAANALAATYKPGSTDIRAFGRSLDVRYVVEGEVRRVNDETVVTAHLVDTVTGSQAWSDRLRYTSLPPGPGQPVPAVQLTKRLRSGLMAAERRRAVDHPEAGNALNLTLRGDALSNDPGGMEGVPAARSLYKDALKLDPNLLSALIGLAGTYDTELEESAAPDRAFLLPEYDRISSRAIALDRTNADAWFVRMAALEWLGRWDEALVAADRMIALDRADTNGVLQRAWILIQTGRPAEALSFIEQALAVDPLESSWSHHFLCKAQLFLGNYGEAVAACEKASAQNNWWINLVYLCAAYSQHGDAAKAASARDALLKQKPGYTVARYRDTYRASPPAFFDLVEKHLAAGLRKAGIREK